MYCLECRAGHLFLALAAIAVLPTLGSSVNRVFSQFKQRAAGFIITSARGGFVHSWRPLFQPPIPSCITASYSLIRSLFCISPDYP